MATRQAREVVDINRPPREDTTAYTSKALTRPPWLRELARMNALSRFADPVYCLMRLILGLTFAAHGAQKIFGMFGGKVADSPLMIAGGWLEGVCGLLIAVGLFTRVAAFLASGTMAVAYFMMHAKSGFLPIVNKGELAVLYSFIFCYIFFYGSGRYSLDAMIWRNRAATVPDPGHTYRS